MKKYLLGEDNKEFGGKISSEDIIYSCYLIEVISRIIMQRNKYTVNKMGLKNITNLIYFSKDYRVMAPEESAEELIKDLKLEEGNFIISDIPPQYFIGIPDEWRMGQKYGELVLDTKTEDETFAEAIIRVYNNPICDIIDDYSCNAFQEPRDNTKIAYDLGYFDFQ